MRLPILYCLLLYISTAGRLVSAQPPPIVQRYVEFLGGQKRWAAVTTIVSRGEYDYGGIKFPFTTWSKAPDSYKFEVPFKGKYYAQAFDGTKGWKIDAFKNETKPTLLTDDAARALANEANVELEDPLINYQVKGSTVTEETDTVIFITHSDSTLKSVDAKKVRLTFKNGHVELYYFSAEAGYLLCKKARSKNTEMDNVWLTSYFSDYHTIDGLKIPFKIVHESNGQKILTITVEKVTINQRVNSRIFQP